MSNWFTSCERSIIDHTFFIFFWSSKHRSFYSSMKIHNVYNTKEQRHLCEKSIGSWPSQIQTYLQKLWKSHTRHPINNPASRHQTRQPKNWIQKAHKNCTKYHPKPSIIWITWRQVIPSSKIQWLETDFELTLGPCLNSKKRTQNEV